MPRRHVVTVTCRRPRTSRISVCTALISTSPLGSLVPPRLRGAVTWSRSRRRAMSSKRCCCTGARLLLTTSTASPTRTSMSWEYRVIKTKQGEYEIREVYYASKKHKKPNGYTAGRMSPMGMTKTELEGDLRYMLRALKKPTLTEEELEKI